jgi:hypothetical protein
MYSFDNDIRFSSGWNYRSLLSLLNERSCFGSGLDKGEQRLVVISQTTSFAAIYCGWKDIQSSHDDGDIKIYRSSGVTVSENAQYLF